MKNINYLLLLFVGLSLLACTGGKRLAKAKLPALPIKGVTASGYTYTKYTDHKGLKVKEGDEVVFHLVVLKNDSTVLQSTYDKNSPFTQVIPPVSKVPKPVPPTFEIITMLTVGDSIQVNQRLDSIPNLPPSLSKEDVLNFRLKLLSVRTKEAVALEREALKQKEGVIAMETKEVIRAYQAGALSEKVQTTASGLKYILHKRGTGKPAVAGKKVKAHYSGFLLDGSPFDNSFKRGEAFEFMLGRGQVIKGWDEGMALLSEGAQATFFIPYQLAYGEEGRPPSIPAKAELVFYIELEKVGL